MCACVDRCLRSARRCCLQACMLCIRGLVTTQGTDLSVGYTHGMSCVHADAAPKARPRRPACGRPTAPRWRSAAAPPRHAEPPTARAPGWGTTRVRRCRGAGARGRGGAGARGRGDAGARLSQLSCEKLFVGRRQRRNTPGDHPPPQGVVLLDRRRRHARFERHVRRRDVGFAPLLDGVRRLEVCARLGVRAARVAQVASPSGGEAWA